MNGGPWLSAADAARLLGVARPTLYAYVSRGYLRSQASPGSTRARVYARDDIERLRQRTEQRRAPDKAAARVLQWGLPVLESSIALIDGERLYYRGEDAVRLAETRSVQDVAALVWTGRFDWKMPPRIAGASPRGASVKVDPRVPFTSRAQTVLAASASRDLAAFDLRQAAVAATGWRIVWLLTSTAAGRSQAGATIDEALSRAWKVASDGVTVIRAALILCADHELNVSSFTARCVASAGSSPYAAVIAGLAALEGPRHGGASARVEATLASMRGAKKLSAAVSEKLRRGEALDGFGHPLYRSGDPRARALLAMLQLYYGRSVEYRYVAQFAKTVTGATGEQPNLDFALAATARVLRLPPGSPLVLFAVGRSIGWVGHAIEQYATGQLIRPRAKYVGVVPGGGKGDSPP
jgi:citrate synthase